MDINEVVNSAASSTEAAQTDVTAASSAEQSNASSQTGVNTPTLEQVTGDVIAKAIAKDKAVSPTESEGKEKESGSTIDADSNAEKVEESKEEASTTTEEKGPIPYDRFREVNEAKATFETQVKELQPMADAQRELVSFCQNNQISEQEFRDGMEFLRLVKQDPTAAKKMLEPIWNQLSTVTGDSLPADLQQAVDDGTLTVIHAKELAKYRGQQAFKSAQGQVSQQQAEQQRQQAFVQSATSAIKSWDDAKVLTDPDFKPKAAPNAADGKFEFAQDRFIALINRNPPKTVADVIKLREQAYTEVAKAFSGLMKKTTAATKNLSSTKSSTTATTLDPTKVPFEKAGEAIINSVLAKHRA